ncbi:PorP/SprF family type IX secretion system membrane protein [Christiangramia sediminis]|uniref:Type IX secretion system membrane protein PorP/SprF n=1 Tax=Christiangramia sediminis TaxID=2881336 RepID=A0A9X1LL83_9FLAO|nr:type IX secretion system membrane protein PorP/SprF [Christiangramia sediminis]MCB7482416.1 type IX secretion system membrane protein PorP/SprF [Christiangramia sediminis]
MGSKTYILGCTSRQPEVLRYSLFLVLIMFLNTSALKAQEIIPTYSDYLTDNLYLIHPSMAGASNYDKIRLTARQQWFDVEDAPNLQTLAYNSRVNDKIGVGGILFRDENGNYSKVGGYATFAYHLMFSRSTIDLNQLSFGISAGVIQHRLDTSGFTRFDPLIGENDADIFANMDFGISYYVRNLYFHFAAKNILSVSRELFYSDAVPSNMRKYLFSAGYVFTLNQNDPWSFEPSLLFQAREATNEMALDLNAKAYYELDNGRLWGGLSYRNGFESAEYTENGELVENQELRYITPFVGLNYKKFVFGYTFSYQLNSIVLSNSGFHQITLGYNFGKSRERYQCKCPAINN